MADRGCAGQPAPHTPGGKNATQQAGLAALRPSKRSFLAVILTVTTRPGVARPLSPQRAAGARKPTSRPPPAAAAAGPQEQTAAAATMVDTGVRPRAPGAMHACGKSAPLGSRGLVLSGAGLCARAGGLVSAPAPGVPAVGQHAGQDHRGEKVAGQDARGDLRGRRRQGMICLFGVLFVCLFHRRGSDGIAREVRPRRSARTEGLGWLPRKGWCGGWLGASRCGRAGRTPAATPAPGQRGAAQQGQRSAAVWLNPHWCGPGGRGGAGP